MKAENMIDERTDNITFLAKAVFLNHCTQKRHFKKKYTNREVRFSYNYGLKKFKIWRYRMLQLSVLKFFKKNYIRIEIRYLIISCKHMVDFPFVLKWKKKQNQKNNVNLSMIIYLMKVDLETSKNRKTCIILRQKITKSE